MMNKMNNKGFLLAESLIVTTFVLTVLIYLFSQFKNLMIEYKKTYQYNTVEDIYNLDSVGKYIYQNKIGLNDNKYLYKDNGSTEEIPIEKQSSFKKLVDSMNIDYLIFGDSDIDNIKKNMTDFNQDMQDFIEKVPATMIEGKGRLLAKFKNGNFATIIIEKIPNPIIKKWAINSDQDFHDAEYREKITNIEFLDSAVVPGPDIPSWDISEKQDKTVMAWLTDNGEGGYNLHIGGDGVVIANVDSGHMFKDFNALKSINFGNNFDTSNVTDMRYMFNGCASLQALDVSKFNTSNVEYMQFMFSGAKGLNNLDLNGWDTSKVTDMNNMFSGTKSLQNLNLGEKFDTSKVGTDPKKEGSMKSMFQDCESLTTLNLGDKFNTSNVTDMSHMFRNSSSLTPLDLGEKFDTSNVTNMRNMFSGCSSLTTLDLGEKFDTSNVQQMQYMFSGCSGLTTLNLRDKFNTSNVQQMQYMFYETSKLTSLDVSSFDTSNVTNMSYMFYGNRSLTNLDVSNFDTSNVTDMMYMFYECSDLSKLILGNKFNTSNVTSMQAMFYNDINLETLDVSRFNTENVTNMSGLFTNCKKIQELDLSSWDTSNVTEMGPGEDELQNGADNLQGIEGMFDGCENLKTIYVSNKFNTSNVIKSSHMFFGCTSLIGGNGTTYNSSKTDKEYARIDKPGELGYFTQK